MIVTDIHNAERYFPLHPFIKEFFAYLTSHDLSEVQPSRISLHGDDLYLNVDEGQLQPADERLLEAHRKYIDIQVPLTAPERFGWKSLNDIQTPPLQPYDPACDIVFYKESFTDLIDVHPGQCYILFPEDAHAPLIGVGSIRKIIGKLRL